MANSLVLKHRYNHDPRLSANQMAEYLSASSVRRRSILREAKYPATVMVIRYEDAYAPIVGHFVGQEDALAGGIVGLKQKAQNDDITDYLRENCDLCVDAIESFRGSLKNLDIGKTKFKRIESPNRKLLVSGVNVSISISMMTEETARDGKRTMGGALLVFSRSAKETEMTERCKAIALLVYEALRTQPKTDALCVPELCMAIDVFRGRLYRAGSRRKQLWRTVETSCEEVSTVWPTVKPPTNYNGPQLPKVA